MEQPINEVISQMEAAKAQARKNLYRESRIRSTARKLKVPDWYYFHPCTISIPVTKSL
jgi:hypothetical protein